MAMMRGLFSFRRCLFTIAAFLGATVSWGFSMTAFASEVLGARVVTTSTTNTGVLGEGALAFETGYNSDDWSGVLHAVALNPDGSQGAVQWRAGQKLDEASPAQRVILTAKFNGDGSFAGGTEFKVYSALDDEAKRLLMMPASVDGKLDTVQTRIDWLRGDKVSESNGTMRKRKTLLGAIIRSQALYISYPSSGYRNAWPVLANGRPAPESIAAASPILGTGNVSYEQFAKDQRSRRPVVYAGANDGMLHAFDASQNADGSVAATAGRELWAYVPRSAYVHLGNLTKKTGFTFAPTVDATPVVQDVFFAASTATPASTSAGWHTVLVGGLGQGGRGVYALDVTQPDPSLQSGINTQTAGSKVLWEFEAAMPVVAASSGGAAGSDPGGNPADLGYTYGQPNIGRLANGRWVVLVPGGRIPHCTYPYVPTSCNVSSALFVLDAQTGRLIAELKTPSDIAGVASYGLSTPVLGDYNDDQVDDVAFAGDLAGNLWRFDLGSSDPIQWKVTLAYKPVMQGAQPITVMPRLLPDPVTNRFIVIFGTGDYSAVDPAADVEATQAVYGIRDRGRTVAGIDNLVAQTLTETVIAGVRCSDTVRGLTSNSVPADKDGWYFNLISPGERVVVTPGALFDTNRLVITTLIPNSQGCSGNRDGAVMVVDGATGGAGDGLSMPSSPWMAGSTRIKPVGGHIDNPPIAGTVPVVSSMGGGKLVFPGIALEGGKPFTADDAIWRRRSWRELMNDL
jgi:type IV pilus assembly protein PilY1